MNCDDDSKNSNTTIEATQQQVVSSLLLSSSSITPCCEQQEQQHNNIIQSQQLSNSHNEINEQPYQQQHQNQQHLTLQQQQQHQSLNVSKNTTMLTSDEFPKSVSTTIMTPITNASDTMIASSTTSNSTTMMLNKKRSLIQNPYASKKRNNSKIIINDDNNNNSNNNGVMTAIRVSNVDDNQCDVGNNDDFMNKNDCVELWNLPLGEPSQHFYLRPNQLNHNNINSSSVQNNITTTINDVVVGDSIHDNTSNANKVSNIVTTIDDIKAKFADTTVIQKHDIPYWMRLPSRALSFGSAEIILISELWQQQLEKQQQNPKQDNTPQQDDDRKDHSTSFSYATKSYRMTGVLLYQKIYSDTSISMLIGDPLETDSIECRSSVIQRDHVVLYRKTNEGLEDDTSGCHNNNNNGMKTPSHINTKSRQYINDQSSSRKKDRQHQNEKTPYLLLDRSLRKKITPVYRKKASSSSLLSSSSSVLKPSSNNNNPTSSTGQGKRRIVKKRLRFSLLLQKHQDDLQEQSTNDKDSTYHSRNNLVDDDHDDTSTKHPVQATTAMTPNITSDCNEGSDILDNNDNVNSDHNNDKHSVSLAQSLTSSIQSVLSSTVNAAMSIFQSSSYEETETEHQHDKINSSQKKVDFHTDNDGIYDRILLEDDTINNDDRICRAFQQQVATVVTPTNMKLDDAVPSCIIANTLLDDSRFQNNDYSTFRKCIWIVIPPSHTISHVDTCRINDLVMIIGELRNMTIHNASYGLRRHDDVNSTNRYDDDDDDDGMTVNNNSSRLNAVTETIQSMQIIHDQKVNKENHANGTLNHDQSVISSKDYDKGDCKKNRVEEKLCLDQYGHEHENEKNEHDENKLYFYIEARIVRNVNGTNMKLYTDALMSRRTFLSNRSSIWK